MPTGDPIRFRRPGLGQNGGSSSPRRFFLVLSFAPLLFAGCKSPQTPNVVTPSVEINSVPPAGVGDPSKTHTIAGRALGARPGQRIVLYAKAEDAWWVQPLADQPFTAIKPDSTWRTLTHPGHDYAALLVGPDFKPPLTAEFLPKQGVIVAAVVRGVPPFWLRWWFSPLCVLAALALVFAIYRLRIRQLTRALNFRFEERLGERTRVAQELHDTLLQGVISTSMQLHLVSEQIPADLPARKSLDHLLESMGTLIEEGRHALTGLRSPLTSLTHLEQAFSQVRQEFADQNDAAFRVIVEGHSHPLHPIMRDEIYCIGREALINAFRHSRARAIEVELEYADRLRLLIRDNGVGFDTKVLRNHRESHYGLSAMRERAKRIGGKLRVLSRPAAGTEVELAVPGHIAFVEPTPGGPTWFSGLFLRWAHMLNNSSYGHKQ